MTIETKHQEDIYTVTPDGWLDTTTAPELRAVIDEIPEAAAELVLECSKLQYISSAGVRLLVYTYKRFGGRIRLLHVSEEVMDVLKMTGIANRIRIESE